VNAEPLSEFDVLKFERLPNWGWVGRQDPGRPDPESISGTIYEHGKEDEREDAYAPPEPPMRVDLRDYEVMDAWVRQMAPRPKRILRNRFYCTPELCANYHPPRATDVDWAIRMLMDMMYENRRVVNRMQRLTYG
jgi:hypothetical protein